MKIKNSQKSVQKLDIDPEDNWTIDEILFCDTGKDFPDMLDHIEKVKRYIKENYNKEITTLKAEKSFDYYMFEHEKTRGKNKGKKDMDGQR